MSLSKILVEAAQLPGSGITFVTAGAGDERVSYYTLYHSALKVLGALQEKGVKPGDEVVLQLEDNKQFLCVFWACLLGKIVPVPLSWGMQTGHKIKLFNVWECLNHPFLVCAESHVSKLEIAAEPGEGIMLQAILEKHLQVEYLIQFERYGIAMPVSGEEIAYIQFSSGSTGEPKGVCLTHENLITNITDIIASLGLTEADTLLSWMPLTHDMGLIGFHLAGLVKGIDTVSIPTAIFTRRPLLWIEKIMHYRATVTYSPCSGLQYFLSAMDRAAMPANDLQCLRLLVNGAEPISMRICNAFIQALRPYGLRDNVITTAYGLAEASVEVSAMPVGTYIKEYHLNRGLLNVGDEIELVDEQDARAAGFVDCGYPVAACKVRICNHEDQELPDHVVGHIQIKGKNVTAGYYNNPDATRRLFTGDQWLRTGDVGFMRKGRLVITGRFKNMLIINGQNFYPNDIEQVIAKTGIIDPGKVVACGINNPVHGQEELVVFLYHKGVEEAFRKLAREVQQIVLGSIGIYTDKIIPVNRIPKTTSGKVQYFRLREQYERGDYEQYVKAGKPMPGNQSTPFLDKEALKKELLVIAGSLLGKPVDEDTDFAEAGLNSITAVQLINRVQQLTGKQLSVRTLFEHATPDLLARHLVANAAVIGLPGIGICETSTLYDLSLAQKRIWMEYKMNIHSCAYHIQLVYRVEGNLDVRLFQKAVDHLIEKYEIFRTAFEWQEHQPVQKIHPFNENNSVVRVIDLSKIKDAVEEARRICEKDARTPFLLENPFAFRVSIIRLGTGSFMLSMIFHHIIVDGWSLKFLIDECSEIYNRLLENEALVVTAQPVLQYKDFVAWQQELLKTGWLDSQRAYWLRELQPSCEPATLSLKVRSAASSTFIRTRTYQYSFNEQEFSKVEQLAKKYKTTKFCMLSSLLSILLYRYTGKQEIIWGFDVSGRITRPLEEIAGYMLNTLCLRVTVQPHQTFSALAEEMHKKLFLALENQLYPFERLLEDMKESGQNGLQPLFRILVLYQHFNKEQAVPALGGCHCKKEPATLQDGFVDLLLEFSETAAGLNFDAQYNQAVYEEGEIAQLVKHFITMLMQVANNDSCLISHYNYFTGEEMTLLFPAHTSINYTNRAALPVHLLFEQQAALHPDAIAVYAGNEVFTYREINESANRLAHFLKGQKNILREDRVGFKLCRNENLVIAMLAILKAGAAWVAFDHELPVNRCMQMIDDCEIQCLLTDNKTHREINKAFKPGFLVNLNDEILYTFSSKNPVFEGRVQDLAYVIYTSGSTGIPKGIMIEHNALSAYVQQFIHYFDIKASDIFIQQSAFGFDTIIEEIFPALCTSGSVVISSNGGRDIERLLSLISATHATVLSTTPLVLKEINELIDSRIATLRLVISGGDVLLPGHIDKIFHNTTVYNTYGPSEATVCASYKRVTSLDSEQLTIGRPINGRNIYIMNEEGQLLPPGKAGEIYIEGGLARGYINNQTLTEKAFVQSPWDKQIRLYRSGDLGILRPDGEIQYLGRKDSQVKLRGHRVEPEETERIINQYNGIQQAAVVLSGGNEYFTAFLCVKADFNPNALRSYLSRWLPSYMIPYRFEIVDKMPLTVTGKIDKVYLRKLAERLQPDTDSLSKEPGNTYEEILLPGIAAILKDDTIGPADNLFEYGCNSIKALQIVNQVQESTGVELKLPDIFEFPTIRQLAQLIGKTESDLFEYVDIG